MPNWCDNHLVLSGPAAKIKALWETANAKNENGDCLLQAMVPIGEWDYARAVDAWGTKWDISQHGLEYEELEGEGIIRGWFESAWSPPILAMQNYCDKNEDVRVTLEYFEPGVGFIGHWNSADQEDCCWEIDPSDLSNIPQDLRESFCVDDWYDTESEEV